MAKQHASAAFEAEAPILSWYKLFFGCFSSDAGSKKWVRRGLWGAVAAAAVFIASASLKGLVSELALDVALSASIASAIGFIHWTTWKYIQDLDELHQRIVLESYAFSFLVTMALVAGFGIFGLAARTAFEVLWIYVAAEVFRGVGLVVVGKKYR